MAVSSIEKVTFNISSELKEKVTELKNELHLSMSAIFEEALTRFVAEQEHRKLEEAAKAMLDEYESNPEMKEWSDYEKEISDENQKGLAGQP